MWPRRVQAQPRKSGVPKSGAPKGGAPKGGAPQGGAPKGGAHHRLNVVWPQLSPNERALVKSQSGPLSSVPFTAMPIHRGSKLDSEPFRVLLLRRLRLPLPFTVCTCRCGRPLDAFGHHRAACSTGGLLGRRGFAAESAIAQIFREGGARVKGGGPRRVGGPEGWGAPEGWGPPKGGGPRRVGGPEGWGAPKGGGPRRVGGQNFALFIWSSKTPPKFNEKTPRETPKERNGGGRGKEKSEILGGPVEGGEVWRKVQGSPNQQQPQQPQQRQTQNKWGPEGAARSPK